MLGTPIRVGFYGLKCYTEEAGEVVHGGGGNSQLIGGAGAEQAGVGKSLATGHGNEAGINGIGALLMN